ncbi:MAG: family 16 glycosylhydrolase [Bacteroidia bacterium]|nr:family 16 glycosylhydrolase [Bacteroidia bacterium]
MKSLIIVLSLVFSNLLYSQARDSWEINGVACQFCLDSADIGQGNKSGRKCVKINYDNNAPYSFPVNPVEKPGYTLIMQDEFDGTSPLEMEKHSVQNYHKKWTVFDGPDWYGNPVFDWDWKRAAKNNGNLEITMSPSPDNPDIWLTSTLQSKLRLRYGFVEAKIKIPEGCGLFPSFWLRADAYGDINIFEFWYLPFDQMSIEQTSRSLHFSEFWCPEPPCNDNIPFPDPKHKRTTPRFMGVPMDDARVGAYFLNLSKDFFIYSLEWNPNEITLYINNTLIGTVPNYQKYGENLAIALEAYAPDFNKPVPNGSGINHPLATPNPSKYTVDYIRIYKKNSDLNSMIEEFPSSVFAGTNIDTPVFQDYFPTNSPKTTYNLSITNQPENPLQRIKLMQKYGTAYTRDTLNGVDWGNVWYNLDVPSGTPEGDYTLKLEVKPRVNGENDTTTLRAYKTLYVSQKKP